MKCVSTGGGIHEGIFYEMLFHKVQENPNEEKASKPRLIILLVWCIVQQ